VALRVPRLLKEVVAEAGRDGIGHHAAALSYFAVFAMPGLLVLVVSATGLAWGEGAVRARLLAEMGAMVGEKGARVVERVLEEASSPRGSSVVGQALGIGALVLGATGFFAHLQVALNAMWRAEGNERRRGVLALVLRRLVSLGMVLALAVLLLVSLAMSAGLSAFGDRLDVWLAGGTSTAVVVALEFAVTYVLVTALFAALFKSMPDVTIEWREVWVGAAVTGFLFLLGKTAIGVYIGRADPGSAYGAAGPLVVILVWIYYSTLVLLLGAEFTQVYARLYGPRRSRWSDRRAAKDGARRKGRGRAAATSSAAPRSP
jgi:membrane protein